MSILFLTEQGTKLTKKGHAFVLLKEGKKVFVYPSLNVSQVVLFGRIEISTAMIHLLFKMGIDTTFLTRYGQFRGRLVGDYSKNISLRNLQFDRAKDVNFCLQFSKNIILAKAKNTLRILQKREHVPIQELARRVNNFKKSLAHVDSLEQLRGMEGYFSAIYFRMFPQLLINSFGFRKRVKHPPPDPVNILLSFGYTLLFQNLYALIMAAGLDPYGGFYHQNRYGHPSLVSDIMEEFRAPVIDAMVVQLINKRMISKTDFEATNNGYRLSKEAINKIVTLYHDKLQTTLKYKGLNLNYLQIMESQVVKVVKAVKNNETYSPFIYR